MSFKLWNKVLSTIISSETRFRGYLFSCILLFNLYNNRYLMCVKYNFYFLSKFSLSLIKMNQKTGKLWTRLTYKISIYCCSKSVKMLPCELPILTRGKTPTVYKELLPKNRPLFTCTNGHRGWQVTRGTKFRQVVKEKEKWHRWSVTDELCIHHATAGKTGRGIVAAVCLAFYEWQPMERFQGQNT